ncbi:MAG: General stress protein 14 [Bacteroidetes bacterium ADurb.Bin397]|nr:MAG: General stress protein 14 [Bacteroidetes bacterium ADurb.Bin397]
MTKILILFAHPLYEKSRIHKALKKAIPETSDITFRDLYELYPDFNINIKQEQQLLNDHDIIIWQHPVYWYSVPPLLKQWIDMVLEFGWAYGPGGDKLKGKYVMNVVSAGGQRTVYNPEGRNRFTVRQFFAPLDQTVMLCNMKYLAPFVVHGTHSLTNDEIRDYASQYKMMLNKLLNGEIDLVQSANSDYMNDLIQ